MTADPVPAAAPRPPGLDDPAPGFWARTTMGPRALSDYRGRWLLLVSHPADFTPVCTSEFVALAHAAPRFEAMGCAILALSVDSLYSHIAWARDIEARFGVALPFPIVEDPSMAIARAYGMLAPGAASSATVRASFAIDPEGIIRAIGWYPMEVGRSVEEMLRLVAALQAARREGGSTPEGWREGEPLLDPAATDLEAAAAGDGTWYHRERQGERRGERRA